MKTDTRRYLAADIAARRLKLDTKTGTPQSSVQTDNQQDPLQEDLADIIGAQLRQNKSLSRQIGKKIVGDPGRHQISSLDRFEERHSETFGSRQ